MSTRKRLPFNIDVEKLLLNYDTSAYNADGVKTYADRQAREKERKRLERQRNAEYYRLYYAEYRRAHKEQRRAINKRYAEKHKTEIAEKRRIYEKANAEKRNAAARRRYAENIAEERRKAREYYYKYKATRELTPEEIERKREYKHQWYLAHKAEIQRKKQALKMQ